MKKRLKLLLPITDKIKTIFVLHPPTEYRLKKWKLFKIFYNKKVEFIPRLDYFRFINLVKNSKFIITDGGSCQEESSYLGIPCLLFRKKLSVLKG